MFKEPEFVIARTEQQIADRVTQLQKDYRVTFELRRSDAREFALRLNVLQSRFTPEEAERRANVGYSYSLRNAAISEAQWLYGYEVDSEGRENICNNAWEFRE